MFLPIDELEDNENWVAVLRLALLNASGDDSCAMTTRVAGSLHRDEIDQIYAWDYGNHSGVSWWLVLDLKDGRHVVIHATSHGWEQRCSGWSIWSNSREYLQSRTCCLEEQFLFEDHRNTPTSPPPFNLVRMTLDRLDRGVVVFHPMSSDDKGPDWSMGYDVGVVVRWNVSAHFGMRVHFQAGTPSVGTQWEYPMSGLWVIEKPTDLELLGAVADKELG